MKVEKVSQDRMVGYVEAWILIESANNITNLYEGAAWYCEEDNGTFTAMDDRDGNCWVEIFATEQLAIDWLNGDCDLGGNYYKEEE